MKQAPEIVQELNQPEVAAKIIAQSLVSISRSATAMLNAGLKRDTLVTLIHARSGVGKRDIELVLNNLTAMQEIWCSR